MRCQFSTVDTVSSLKMFKGCIGRVVIHFEISKCQEPQQSEYQSHLWQYDENRLSKVLDPKYFELVVQTWRWGTYVWIVPQRILDSINMFLWTIKQWKWTCAEKLMPRTNGSRSRLKNKASQRANFLFCRILPLFHLIFSKSTSNFMTLLPLPWSSTFGPSLPPPVCVLSQQLHVTTCGCLRKLWDQLLEAIHPTPSPGPKCWCTSLLHLLHLCIYCIVL